MSFEEIGLKVPKILIPKKSIDMTKWAVVACDQYTSEPEYWDSVKEIVADDPSTLKIIFPEVYLEAENKEEIISSINKTMEEYLQEGIFEEIGGFILVDRKTSQADSRKGLVVALDLEKYDYNKGSQTLIRATEGTIVERLPPRMEVRRNAKLELPHIMVLIDDPEKKVIEPLFEEELEKVYDFELMKGSGHIKGWKVTSKGLLGRVAEKLQELADKDDFKRKYSVTDKGVLLFAMGDGNHSLATAKAIWEEKKASGASMDDPARYALVELVNVHDEGLEFEPIHRVIFDVDTEEFFKEMESFFKGRFRKERLVSKEKVPGEHKIRFVTAEEEGVITIKDPKLNLEIGTLQSFLDHFTKKKGAKIDYIHGEEVVKRLGSEKGNIGFFLPPMEKKDLFKTVIVDGALPRKTFSMGEADEKRFYLEARKIR